MDSKVVFCFLILFFAAEASARTDTTGGKDFFFRGTEYTKIFTIESGTPFLEPRELSSGWVEYYGSRYIDVKLQYDIEDDQVVSLDLSGTVRMQLVKQKITAFGIGARKFIRIASLDIFFEQVYDGGHDVLTRWQKVLTRTGTEEGKYKLYRSYHIWNGEVLANIQSPNDLFGYFGKHSKELKEYFRDQKLSFKKDPEKALMTVVSYADKNGWHGR